VNLGYLNDLLQGSSVDKTEEVFFFDNVLLQIKSSSALLHTAISFDEFLRRNVGGKKSIMEESFLQIAKLTGNAMGVIWYPNM
jgi:hypothetical protein